MNRQQVDTLKFLANDKVLSILDRLGVDYSERYKYVYSSCPVHGGEKSNGWSWHLELGMWGCWTRGCHEEFGKDIFGLVRGVLDCKFPEALEFVKKIVGNEKVDVSEVLQLRDNKQFITRAKRRIEKVYPETCLNKLIYHAYLEGRGYPKDLVESYHIGISGSKYKRMSNRIIIPVRNLEGQLVGFTGRTLFEDWKDRGIGKWEHSEDFSSRDNLFNIDRAAEYIKETGTVILCEGPLDVLRLEQSGVHNSVAIFGRVLHPGQVTLLIKIGGVNKLIMAFDGDVAGKTGAEDAAKLAKDFFNISFIKLDNGDVGDLSPRQVQEIFV